MKERYLSDLDTQAAALDVKQQQLLRDINKLTKEKNNVRKRAEKDSQQQLGTLKDAKSKVEELRTTLAYKNKEIEIKVEIHKNQTAALLKASEAVRNCESELELLEMSCQIQRDKNESIEAQKAELARVYSSLKALVS